MHYCNVCDYKTSILSNMTKHYTTQKHLNNLNNLKPNIKIIKSNDSSIDNKTNELNQLKKEYEYKLKIEKLKHELDLKTLECKSLEQIIIQKNNQINDLTNTNNTNNTNNEITNNINIVIINVKDNIDPMLLVDTLISNQYDKTDNKWITKSLLNQLNNIKYPDCHKKEPTIKKKNKTQTII